MDGFTRGYIDCALWCGVISEDGGDDEYTIDNLAPVTLAQMYEDCQAFQRDNAEDLAAYYETRHEEHAGHDFYLTRCKHGAGFWDRDLGDLGERLSAAARRYNSYELYVGDDGAVYGQ